MMVNVLLNRIVTVYLDDMIIFRRTDEEFIVNMELLFQRYYKRLILPVTQRSAVFGLSEIEYVGHTLTRDGLDFL